MIRSQHYDNINPKKLAILTYTRSKVILFYSTESIDFPLKNVRALSDYSDKARTFPDIFAEH